MLAKMMSATRVIALLALCAGPVAAEPEGICCLAPNGEGQGLSAASHSILNGVVLLTFEGLQDQEPVGSFYDGSTAGFGSGPGPSLGIVFSSNALAIIDADAGGAGNFGGEPSPDTVIYFLTGSGAVMNVPAGFTTGFSFFYSAIGTPGSISVYDGLDATGNLLASLPLPLTPANGAPDPTGSFSPFVPIGVAFNGVARSVDFAGTINQIGFDNITIGSDTPLTSRTGVPASSPAGLIGAGLVLLAIGRSLLRRRRGASAYSTR